MEQPVTTPPPRAAWLQHGGECIVEISGDWHRDGPAVMMVDRNPDLIAARYQMDGLGSYDSTLPAFLLAQIRAAATATSPEPGLSGMPDNLRGLLELALAVPEKLARQPDPDPVAEFSRLGRFSQQIWREGRALLDFTGQTVLSLARLCTGRARFRASDFWLPCRNAACRRRPSSRSSVF